MRTAAVTFYCTGVGLGTPHDRVHVFTWEGPIPVPQGYSFTMSHSVLSFDCEPPSKGGCGYAPRPSDELLHRLVDLLADTPEREMDISYWSRRGL